MQKRVSDHLVEKQAQLAATQSRTEELDADLDQLMALKRQVDKTRGHEGCEEPRPGNVTAAAPHVHGRGLPRTRSSWSVA